MLLLQQLLLLARELNDLVGLLLHAQHAQALDLVGLLLHAQHAQALDLVGLLLHAQALDLVGLLLHAQHAQALDLVGLLLLLACDLGGRLLIAPLALDLGHLLLALEFGGFDSLDCILDTAATGGGGLALVASNPGELGEAAEVGLCRESAEKAAFVSHCFGASAVFRHVAKRRVVETAAACELLVSQKLRTQTRTA